MGAYCNLRDSDPFEYLHIKFIKEILHVGIHSIHVACLAELNMFPQKTKLNFWDHISSSTNTLVNKIYKNLTTNSRLVTTIKEWTQKLGFGYLVDNSSNIKNTLGIIKQKIYDQTLQHQQSMINESNKLSFSRNIYKPNQRPPYVDICRFKSNQTKYFSFLSRL
jgi:hypothetical protein